MAGVVILERKGHKMKGAAVRKVEIRRGKDLIPGLNACPLSRRVFEGGNHHKLPVQGCHQHSDTLQLTVSAHAEVGEFPAIQARVRKLRSLQCGKWKWQAIKEGEAAKIWNGRK